METSVWRVTAAEAEAAQRRAAGFLHERGLVAGDRVALSVANAPAVLHLVLGALRAGIVPVVLNPTLTAEERDVLLADARPALVIDNAPSLGAAIEGPEHELAPVPLARPMHYTSGTSGQPKGVWSGVLDTDDATALFTDERDLWAFTADDVLLVCSPLHHSAPIRFATSVLLSGGDVVLLERFEAGAVREAIASESPSAAFLVPSHLHRLFTSPAGLPDLRSFRLLAHAGEPCPPQLKEWAVDAFPDGSVWEFYGSTEGQFTVCSPDDWHARPGTVGRARPHRALAVDEHDEIWCRVPPWARFEYWSDPAKTAAAWNGDAFTVGDLGRLDEDGYLYLDGRRDDLIISGGVNVYPAEIEQALGRVDGVVEIAAFGVADDRWGQRVCVAVIGNAGTDAILAAAREHLAPYKRPKDVFRVDALPRTSTGKVRRSVIAATLGLES